MKILIVCQFYYPENFVITNIAEKLASYGHEVDVLTGKPNYGYGEIIPEYKHIKEQEINGVKIHRVKLIARKKSRISIVRNYLSFWSNSKKWVRKCKENFDIVYSMSLSPVTILSAGNKYKKKHHVPHVVHCVDLWPESVLITHAVKKKSLTYKILYKWSRGLYKNTDEILIGSPSYEQYFTDVLSLPDIQRKFVPQPSLVESSDAEPFEFDKDYFNILYCGNLGTIQNIEMIPDAMKTLKDKKIRFHIIGMGPKSDNLVKLIKEYGLEDSVKYYGPIPAKKAAAYFKSADALYVSLKGEGYVGKTIPNKLVMSMAFEKPILAMLGGDGKEVLVKSDGGVIALENVESLSNSIVTISSMPKEQLKRLGSNNLIYYKNHFSLDTISKEIENELLQKLR